MNTDTEGVIWSLYLGGDRVGEYDIDDRSLSDMISIAMEQMSDFVKAGGYGACEVNLEDVHGQIVKEVLYVHSDQPIYRQMALDHYCRNWDLVSVRPLARKKFKKLLDKHSILCYIIYVDYAN